MPCKMHRKKIHHGLKILLIGLCLTGAFGCSGSESDDENLEASDNSNKGDLGGDDAKEGNGQENYVDTDEGKGGKGGADVNSATADGGDGGGGSGNLLGEAGAGDMPPSNAAAGGAAPLNAAPLNPAAGNPAAGNPAAGAPPVNAANTSAPAAATPPPAAPSAATAAAATGPNSPMTGGRVRYVKDGGVQAVNAPNGSPVATLEQGEHPITWEENGWLKITTGMYVPADGMSNTGVPRPQTGGGWAH